MIFERDFTFYILYFVCNVNNGKIVDNVQYIVDFCYLNINTLVYINGKELIESKPYNRNLQFNCVLSVFTIHMLNLTKYVACPFCF